MLIVIQKGCLIALMLLGAGSLLNLSSSPHWFVRGWDFPRVQILVAAGILAAGWAIAQRLGASDASASFRGRESLIVIGLLLFLAVWHGVRILPYTFLQGAQSQRSESHEEQHSLRIVISNVELENDHFEQWQQVIRTEDPDILIVLEVDEVWMKKIEPLRREFLHEIAYPQDNWYGMLMLSRLPVLDSEIRFLVESDIPSIDAAVRLRSGHEIRVVGVHPRPAEPIRDNDSKGRDAELVAYAKLLREEQRPVVIGGDLNDVAWSETTQLFLKISGLLDPRRGRGFYNTFHADHWWMRFPLDHLFHSQHFTVRTIRRLPHVGSDHFPILLELQFEPHRVAEQEPLEPTREDEQHAEELLERKPTADLHEQEPPGHRTR